MALAAEGLWTLEVPDHALGRAVERSGFLHPETIIRNAHRNLLDMPNAALLSSDGSTRFKTPYIKAGLGCFVGEFFVGEDASIGGQCTLTRLFFASGALSATGWAMACLRPGRSAILKRSAAGGSSRGLCNGGPTHEDAYRGRYLSRRARRHQLGRCWHPLPLDHDGQHDLHRVRWPEWEDAVPRQS